MSDPSLHLLDHCPSCQKPLNAVDWFTWCSKCGTIVCSECVESVHDCKDGFSFEVAGRGTRYFNTVRVHEEHEHKVESK